MQSAGPERFLAVDLESTGTKPETDRIVEFAIVELDAELKEVGAACHRVNPGIPIPAPATAVHGITDKDVADLATFERHAPRLQRLLPNYTLIAYNAAFDVRMLHFELVRAGLRGLELNQPVIDPLTIERFVNSHRLEEAFKRYTGTVHTGAHNALDDARAAVEVLRRQRGHPALPTHLSALHVQHIETLAGRPAKRWLDHAHRFYADETGTVRFGFGCHNDKAAAAERSYLNWMVAGTFPSDTKAVAMRLLKGAAVTA